MTTDEKIRILASTVRLLLGEVGSPTFGWENAQPVVDDFERLLKEIE